MKETTIEIKAYQCEACGRKHTEDWHGKWSIFHCPEHGEFCNDGGLYTCGLFRFHEAFNTKRISCPICGWTAIESWTEKYDDRKGEKPKTEREIESFKKAQNYLMSDSHNNSGYASYKRIEKAGVEVEE